MKHYFKQYSNALAIAFFAGLVGSFLYYMYTAQQLRGKIVTLQSTNSDLQKQSSSISAQLRQLQNEDQVVINKNLNSEVKQINTIYKKAVSVYEKLLEIKGNDSKKIKYDSLFASSLNYLADKKYASADAVLRDLDKQLEEQRAKQAVSSVPASFSGPVNNTPPGSGYSRQRVKSDIGEYVVDIVSADLGSTRVIVDTASDEDCKDNCLVLSLGDYVGRNGAFAGVNGSYFCPASYPSCAGKANSFDTLLMNKKKTYFNSDNNVYSTVPAAIFLGGSVRYVGQSLEWGRDTGVDGVIANQPLLLSGGNIVFGGSGDPKQGSKGSRSFVGSKGSTVYIGVVHNATVAEVAHVLKAMGLEGALNLDSGGSTAFWAGGYKAGPGRAIPNAVLFVRK